MASRWLFPGLFCWLLWSSCLYAQDPVTGGSGDEFVFRNLDNSSGLISDEVFSVTQDKAGYIWIGTLKGLQRYDGFRFRSFVDSAARTNDELLVSSLYADSSQDRLIYNQFISQMQQRSGLDRHATLLLAENIFNASKAKKYRGAGGDSWLKELYYLAKRTPNGRVSSGLALVKEPSGKKAYFAFFFSDSISRKTWITEPGHGLLLFDDSSRRVYLPGEEPDPNPLMKLIRDEKLAVRKIYLDQRGDFWLLSWSEFLYRLPSGSKSLLRYDISTIGKTDRTVSDIRPFWATSILQDNHGVIWVGTGHAGLLRYQPESDRFVAIKHRAGDALSLQYNHEINNLFQDKEENIWVATDKGASFFNPYQQDFTRPDAAETHPEKLPASEVNGGFVDSAGNLAVVYWGGGLRLYDRKLALKKTLTFPGRETNMLWGLLQDDEGITWVGCQHGFIHLLDREYNFIRTMQPPEMAGSTIRCLAKDTEGNILFGLHNGRIVTWNARQKKFQPFADSLLPSGFDLSPVLNIFFDKQNRCWAGLSNGLALFDLQKHCYTGLFKPDVKMPTPCHGIDQLNDSMLVTGLENTGLYFFNTITRSFSRPPGNNLPSTNNVYAVKKDRIGNIWFTTDFDLYRYNPEYGTYSLSSPEKGYLNSGFEGNFFIPTGWGEWFSWTRTEMIGFDPAALAAAAKISSPVSITGLTVYDQPLFIDSLLKSHQPVRLSYKNNFIGISFSNLLFSRAGRTRYFYRLIGVDKDWVTNGSRHLASYTNLAPGSYRFEVTTENTANGKDMASFELIITPPFWQTTWFRALALLITSGIFILIVRSYIRNIRRESDMKQQIVRTEMMALRAQMNPHFIFNCINSIDALIQSNDKYLATVYLNKFAKLIRNILDSSRENTITLRQDLETLQLYVDLEKFRNRDNFSVEIRTGENIFQQEFRVPPLIIQPYVENAILHGLRNRMEGGGKLTIDISLKKEQLLYVIQDNGVGRSAARSSNKKYRSYGMEMSLDRLKLFNQQADIPVIITDLFEDGKPSGTRVEVSLQIK